MATFNYALHKLLWNTISDFDAFNKQEALDLIPNLCFGQTSLAVTKKDLHELNTAPNNCMACKYALEYSKENNIPKEDRCSKCCPLVPINLSQLKHLVKDKELTSIIIDNFTQIQNFNSYFVDTTCSSSSNTLCLAGLYDLFCGLVKMKDAIGASMDNNTSDFVLFNLINKENIQTDNLHQGIMFYYNKYRKACSLVANIIANLEVKKGVEYVFHS